MEQSSYYSRVLMKQFGKLKIYNNTLERETKEYSQIVLPSNLPNILYNEHHSLLGHLGTDKVFDLARRRFD